MRVVFLAPSQPFPPFKDGTRLRAHYLLRSLVKQADVHLISPLGEGDAQDTIRELGTLCNSHTLVGSSGSRPIMSRATRYLAHKALPYRFPDRAVVKEVKDGCRAYEPDVIHAQLLLTAGWALACPGIPRVLDLVDSESLYLQKNSRIGTGYFSKAKWVVRAYQVRLAERRILPRFSAVAVSSPEDAAYVHERIPVCMPHVVPNGVDCDHFACSDPDSEEPVTLGICGSFDYFPNVDAVRFFTESALPPLREMFPALRLLLIGRDPHDALSRFASMPGVITTGEIADIRKAMARCQVLLSPVRLGSGIKNTVLQAMSMGKPVVATEQAVRAIQGRPGEHFMVGNSTEAIVGAVSELLAHPSLRREIGMKARQLVQREYSWEGCAARFLDLYEGIREAGGSAAVRPTNKSLPTNHLGTA